MILSNFPTAQPAPIVGENGNWWVWDAQTRAYVDTGDPSRGETGARGADGAPGPKGDKGDSGGTPIPVSSASAMTDTNKLYLYTGSQSGYQTNYVYGYVDGAWTALLPYGGGGGSSITVDNALSSTSENPVQNKAVKAALDGKGTYSKPSGGIPKSDLASAVQTSLGKADTALQEHQDISGKQDTLIASGAAVGQIAKITAVDANGKPTAWEAADMAGGGKQWRRITSITLTEEVNAIEVTKDLDNQPIHLSEFYFLVTSLPVADTANAANIFSCGANTAAGGLVGGLQPGFAICKNVQINDTSNTRYYYCYAKFIPDVGCLAVTGGGTALYNHTEPVQQMLRGFTALYQARDINRVLIVGTYGTKAIGGVGSTVMVWGVDA